MIRRLTVAAVAASLAALAAAPASAAVFTDRTAFDAAVTPNGSEDFESFATDQEFRTQTQTAGIFTFTGGTALGGASSNLIGPSGAISGASGVQAETSRPQNFDVEVRIDFATTLIAWGADFFSFGGASQQTTITFFDAADMLI
ncbi:MAG: hypothetical protein GC152_03415 [Alphaproteobacteria bacterium]|nr:hypothetical protein [Alphaproteobacteria bacterium]